MVGMEDDSQSSIVMVTTIGAMLELDAVRVEKDSELCAITPVAATAIAAVTSNLIAIDWNDVGVCVSILKWL